MRIITLDQATMTVFNLGCVDEINTFDIKNILVNDSHNHPLDNEKMEDKLLIIIK